MVSAMKALLAVAIIASVACSAYALRCYQCESLTNPKCGEHFEADDKNLLECITAPRFLQALLPMRNATGCMKQRLDSVAGHPQIVRSCYFGDPSNTQLGCQSDPALPFVKQLSCDVCTKDACNGSSATGPIAAAILLFFAFARFMS